MGDEPRWNRGKPPTLCVIRQFDHVRLGLQQADWNEFWNTINDHAASTFLRIEQRVVDHYEQNHAARLTRSLIDCNRCYRGSLRSLVAG